MKNPATTNSAPQPVFLTAGNAQRLAARSTGNAQRPAARGLRQFLHTRSAPCIALQHASATAQLFPKIARPSDRSFARPATSRRLSAALSLIALLLAPALTAQDSANLFRGEIGSSLTGIYADDGSFVSPLNPGNMAGLTDLSLSTSANLRIEKHGDKAALDFRVDFSAYPIGDMLYPAYAFVAAGDPTFDPTLAYAAGDTIWSADITRAALLWYPVDSLQITLGRQSLVSGYGFAWSPYDLVNPPKDPADPKAFAKGVDGLSVNFSPVYWLSLLGYALMPGGGADIEDLIAGGEVSVFTNIGEFRVSGLYGGSEDGSADPYPDSASAAAYIDVGGVGLYAEVALRSRSRIGELSAGGTQIEVTGPVWSALGGMEYVLPSGVSLVAEYFYNGEGWDKQQRQNFLNGVTSAPTLANIALYLPAFYSVHYAMINATVPLYGIDGQLSVSTICSIDSGALMFTPELTVNLDSTGNLSGKINYGGIFDLYGEASGEAALTPADHQLGVSLSYAF